jgi:hypothetical protein
MTKFEQDRRAILAMQGAYRSSFQFIESAGFTEKFTPSRPYSSWGTEVIQLLEDRGDFISLQHTLVMYFQHKNGEVLGPMIMKHWRQDWQYEDQDVFEYTGDNQWVRTRKSAEVVSGQWSQFVYQVDDSPRYEVIGKWTHGEQYSAWQSQRTGRPLPRREFSVRDDYNLLTGKHTITLTPTGWVHSQANQKVLRTAGTDTYLAQEIGINRYERIVEPVLQPAADRYWQQTGQYWAAVRQTWDALLETKPSVTLKKSIAGSKLYQYHFEFAGRLEKGEEISQKDQIKHAQETISSFILNETDPSAETGRPDKHY